MDMPWILTSLPYVQVVIMRMPSLRSKGTSKSLVFSHVCGSERMNAPARTQSDTR